MVFILYSTRKIWSSKYQETDLFKEKMKVYHIKQIGCDFIAMICSLLQKYLTWKTTDEHFIPETLKT